jgi:hypothetical protein
MTPAAAWPLGSATKEPENCAKPVEVAASGMSAAAAYQIPRGQAAVMAEFIVRGLPLKRF